MEDICCHRAFDVVIVGCLLHAQVTIRIEQKKNTVSLEEKKWKQVTRNDYPSFLRPQCVYIELNVECELVFESVGISC
jgi:hypothetical protein